MARVKGPLTIVGNLKGISLYTIKGSDTVYVRTKGGPKKNRIKNGKEFQKLRLHHAEWPGAVLFSRYVRYAVNEFTKLADYNITPVLNGMGKRLMKLDTVNPVGQRSVLISKAKYELEGFDFNRNFPFSSVFRAQVSITITKNPMSIQVRIPRLRTANDVLNVQKLPYFKLAFAVSHIPDLYFEPTEGKNNNYMPPEALYDELQFINGLKIETEWLSTNDVVEPQEFSAGSERVLTDEQLNRLSFFTSGAIWFGAPAQGGKIEMVPHACCAKILTVE